MKRGNCYKRLDPYSNQPKFQQAFETLHQKHQTAPLGSVTECIFSGITPKSGGDAYAYTQDDGILFIKSGSLSSDGTITIDSSSKIKEDIHNGIMKSSKLQKNDVLIAIVGATIGKVGLYDEDMEANINQAIAAVRLHTDIILPDFLICYLLSTMGQTYLEYLKRPVARANINLQEIAEIQVPILTPEKQRIFAKRFYQMRSRYKNKIQQAENILKSLNQYILTALNIQIKEPNLKLCDAIPLKDVRRAGTLSVEYFHPERMAALNALHGQPSLDVKQLSVVVDFHRDIVDAATRPEKYLGLAGVESHTGELCDTVEEAAGQAFTYQTGDVLYGRLRPYLNKVLLAEQSGICSTEFYVMRVKNMSNLLPEYLAEIMRSNLILAQTKHMMTGNTHPRITNSDIKNLYIPVPDVSIQQEITNEIRTGRNEARALRQDAEKEWATAKRQFEKDLFG